LGFAAGLAEAGRGSSAFEAPRHFCSETAFGRFLLEEGTMAAVPEKGIDLCVRDAERL